jgi:hypothetical protein
MRHTSIAMQPATMTRITGLQRIDFGQQWPSRLRGAPDVMLSVKYIPVPGCNNCLATLNFLNITFLDETVI